MKWIALRIRPKDKMTKVTIEQFGWYTLNKEKSISIFRGNAKGKAKISGVKKINKVNLTFVGAIITDRNGIPQEVVSTLGGVLDPNYILGDAVRTFNIKCVGQFDEDKAYEAIINDTRYAGASDLLLNFKNEGSLEMQRIHSAAWD